WSPLHRGGWQVLRRPGLPRGARGARARRGCAALQPGAGGLPRVRCRVRAPHDSHGLLPAMRQALIAGLLALATCSCGAHSMTPASARGSVSPPSTSAAAERAPERLPVLLVHGIDDDARSLAPLADALARA